MTSPSGIAPASPPPTAANDKKQPVRQGYRTLACLIMVAGCVTIADLLLKRGAMAVQTPTGDTQPLELLQQGVAALASVYTLAGIVFHLAGLGAWLYTLRKIPLVLAYSFTAVQQATIALGAWLCLGERITPLRWSGIVCVMAGVLVLVPTIVVVEHRTDVDGGGGGGGVAGGGGGGGGGGEG